MKNNYKNIVKKIISIVLIFLLIVINYLCILNKDEISDSFGSNKIDTSNIDFSKTSRICETIEDEGIVLLKNNGNSLPLENKKVNIFGWSSIDMAYSGGGSGSSGSISKAIDLYEGLEKAGFLCNPTLKNIYYKYKSSRDSTNYWMDSYPYLNLIEPDVTFLKKNLNMKEIVKFSDTALVVITRLGGEHQDLPKRQEKYKGETDETRTYLEISTEEESIFNLLREYEFENIIVIINSINSMNLKFLDNELIDAAISVGAVGQYGNLSIGKVLSGDITPSGHLSDTISYDFSTSSTYSNSPDGQLVNSKLGGVKQYTNDSNSFYIDYQESIYVGYKWYETAFKEGFWDSEFAKEKWNIENGYKDVVQFPFGFGLSYTEFSWKMVDVSPKRDALYDIDTIFKYKIEVKNIGNYKGADVVELYYEAPYNPGGIEKSSKNLIDFAKTKVLSPGESQIIDLSFKATDMASYDFNDANNNNFMGYELESGNYNLYFSTDCHNVKKDDFLLSYKLTNDIKLRKIDSKIVINSFTGDDSLDAGISIDGSNSGNKIKYLTRSNFYSSFPSLTTMIRSKDFDVDSNWNTYVADDSTIRFDIENNLRLSNNKTLNIPLILELGSDYYNPKWDLLLDQMSVDDYKKLIFSGGYKTEEIASIGKPKLLDLDGPQGFNNSMFINVDQINSYTFFPSETVLAQTFNKNLAYTYGLAIGYEGSSSGISGWYAPACNIHRTPFGGRNFEYYSEDSILSGIMAANTILGATNNGLYCYLKHYAVNETANILNQASVGLYTWLTEQALREIYLKPFEIAVKDGKANAIMAAYNRIGATWCGASYGLNTEVLREEWGFQGSVITDAWSTTNCVYDLNLGLLAGTNLLLNSSNIPSSIALFNYIDFADKAILLSARNSVKNILYSMCNSVYRLEEFKRNKNYLLANYSDKKIISKEYSWIIILSIIDICVVTSVIYLNIKKNAFKVYK